MPLPHDLKHYPEQQDSFQLFDAVELAVALYALLALAIFLEFVGVL